MQSRLAFATAKFNRRLLSGNQTQFPAERLRCATSSGRTADPAEHAVDHDEVYPTEAIHDEKLRHAPQEREATIKDDQPYAPPKSPFDSAPKIKSSGIAPRIDPIAQQKRDISIQIDVLSCGTMGGDPWSEEESETGGEKQKEEQHDDYVEYFKHHKASPLSEIEIADTRKPISRATDGTAQNETVRKEGTGSTVWRAEQLDTAEDSLRRAMEVFKWNAARGDPDSPHGRVLRELRGEYW